MEPVSSASVCQQRPAGCLWGAALRCPRRLGAHMDLRKALLGPVKTIGVVLSVGLALAAVLPMVAPATIRLVSLTAETGAEPRQAASDWPGREAPGGAITTRSGLQFVILKQGVGSTRPRPNGVVAVTAKGWAEDGSVFLDASDQPKPLHLRVDQLIKGLSEGIQAMVVGEECVFWIPGDLAYGRRPSASGVPAGALVVRVRLVSL